MYAKVYEFSLAYFVAIVHWGRNLTKERKVEYEKKNFECNYDNGNDVWALCI